MTNHQKCCSHQEINHTKDRYCCVIGCECSFEKNVHHNQCEICLKKYRTALGFHKHYPKCLEKKYQ